MHRSLLHIILALFIAMTFSFTVAAQEENQQETKPFDASSYRITPPADWFVVTGDISEKDRMKLPAAVREHYNPRAIDAMFMALDNLNTETQDFKDSLNIVVVNEPVPLTNELKSELTIVLKQQYEAMFETFEVEGTELEKLGTRNVLTFTGQYQLLGYKVKLKQWLIPSSNESLVITCTYDASREEVTLPLCEKSLQTLEFK